MKLLSTLFSRFLDKKTFPFFTAGGWHLLLPLFPAAKREKEIWVERPAERERETIFDCLVFASLKRLAYSAFPSFPGFCHDSQCRRWRSRTHECHASILCFHTPIMASTTWGCMRDRMDEESGSLMDGQICNPAEHHAHTS